MAVRNVSGRRRWSRAADSHDRCSEHLLETPDVCPHPRILAFSTREGKIRLAKVLVIVERGNAEGR
jgi:hypothetical protein